MWAYSSWCRYMAWNMKLSLALSGGKAGLDSHFIISAALAIPYLSNLACYVIILGN